MALKTRNLKLTDGSITSFRFSDVEWSAIEQAAKAREMRWPEWARQLIDADRAGLTGATPNRAGLLRRAALEEAFGLSLMAERAEMMWEGREITHPMLANRFWPLDGEALVAELEMVRVTYRANFTSFELVAGYRGDVPVLILRNKLENGLSMVLTRDPVSDDGHDDAILDLPPDDQSILDLLTERNRS